MLNNLKYYRRGFASASYEALSMISSRMKPNQSMAHKNHGNFIQTKKFSINVSNLSQLGKLLHREVVEEQHALSDAMEDEHNLQKMRGKIEDNGFEIIDLTGQASVKLTKKSKRGRIDNGRI
mmetsp:Transcript_14385/g.20377  ORF Transcript_14385/g.20377 Transcript_14385/m.20377 type:complete len:122 (+) Transcript_14385:84-449(+)